MLMAHTKEAGRQGIEAAALGRCAAPPPPLLGEVHAQAGAGLGGHQLRLVEDLGRPVLEDDHPTLALPDLTVLFSLNDEISTKLNMNEKQISCSTRNTTHMMEAFTQAARLNLNLNGFAINSNYPTASPQLRNSCARAARAASPRLKK